MANKCFWLIVCILALMVSMMGCVAGSSNLPSTPPPPKAEFFYALTTTNSPNNLSFQLSSFKLDPSSGALSPTSTIPFPSPQFVPGIVVDPGSKFLYLSDVATPSANFIDLYSIDATTGAPTPAGALPLNTVCIFCPPPSAPGALAVDPSGKFLYYGSSSVGGGVAQGVGSLGVDTSKGGLSFVPGSPFSADQIPFVIIAHPSGQFVYTENTSGLGPDGLALQNISGYSVDSNTGALAPVPGSPFTSPVGGDLAGFVMHPSGKFLYASTGSAAHGILGWSIDATTGKLTDLPGSPFQNERALFSDVLDPAGKFLYVSAADGIHGFTVDSNTGVLIPIGGSPFFTGSALVDLVVDPSGQFLFALDIRSRAITGFRLDATTGVPTALGNPTPLGATLGLFTIVKAP